MEPTDISFVPGDPAPFFEGRTGGHAAFPFHAVAGRHVALSFFGSMQNPLAADFVHHILQRHRHRFDDKKACFFGISVDPADERAGLLRDQIPGIRFIRDFDMAVSRLYGVAGGGGLSYRPLTLILDPMMRVLATISIQVEGAHKDQFDHAIESLDFAEQEAAYNAPVLVLPRVFELQLNEVLIARHEEQRGRESGVMQEIGGMTTEVGDRRRKMRRDVMIADTALQDEIRARLARRIIPAIAQAFHFRVTRLERYLVACYDAQMGGFFTAHRDNVTRGTAHRRFAVTVNLNEDYDGGELVFPEFGSRRYRTAAGGAIVFSCSLMHEVLPVHAGKRFAFLPFMHDESAEQIRLQNQKFVSGEMVKRG